MGRWSVGISPKGGGSGRTGSRHGAPGETPRSMVCDEESRLVVGEGSEPQRRQGEHSLCSLHGRDTVHDRLHDLRSHVVHGRLEDSDEL